jgi:hypothetical protein
MLKHCVLSLLFFSLALLAAQTSRAEDYLETGHFGIEGLVLAVGTHSGVVYEGSSFEGTIDLSASDTVTHSSGLNVETRWGLRTSIGHSNYVSYGVDWYNQLFSSQGGVSTYGSMFVGPYVGFQRYWNANVMLTFYVLPVDYNQNVSNNGSGGRGYTHTYEFFNEGGVGVAYLF